MIAPEHPSVRTLLGSTNVEILKTPEQLYWRKCVVAHSVLPPLTTEEAYKGVMPGTVPVHGQSWPPEQTRAS